MILQLQGYLKIHFLFRAICLKAATAYWNAPPQQSCKNRVEQPRGRFGYIGDAMRPHTIRF